MQQCYYDAMAIVAKFGRPAFFLTMTANPKWKEVTRNLRYGETAADQPDLMARVFRQKFRQLIHDLTSKHVLGHAVAYTYVVEFQKRGLPHAHIALKIRPGHEPKAPDEIDKKVSTQIPTRPMDPL